MSKLKIMYDVINKMKEKEGLRGTFKAVANKDQVEIGHFVNEFEKNFTNGETKVKINAEFDCAGKRIKHDSQSEFTLQGCCSSHRHHGFLNHMPHHHSHPNSGDQSQNQHKCCGIKGRFTKLAFLLNILHQIKVEEKEDKSVILSLSLNEIPEELKKVCQAKMSQPAKPENHPHHGFMQECCTLRDPKIELNIWINQAKEVEKLVVTVDGNQSNGLNENHEVSLKAELLLA